jgi:hypothetical protein
MPIPYTTLPLDHPMLELALPIPPPPPLGAMGMNLGIPPGVVAAAAAGMLRPPSGNGVIGNGGNGVVPLGSVQDVASVRMQIIQDVEAIEREIGRMSLVN